MLSEIDQVVNAAPNFTCQSLALLSRMCLTLTIINNLGREF